MATIRNAGSATFGSVVEVFDTFTDYVSVVRGHAQRTKHQQQIAGEDMLRKNISAIRTECMESINRDLDRIEAIKPERLAIIQEFLKRPIDQL